MIIDQKCARCDRKAVVQYNLRYLCAEHAFEETKERQKAPAR